MGQAMTVVVISSVAAGIGSLRTMGGAGVIIITIVAIVGWFIWAGLTYLIGTKLLPEPQTQADLSQLLRTIGFSASPGVLRILGIIPVLGPVINFAVSVWMLVAMVIAVRQALDYQSTGRAVGVCLIGFVVYLVLSTMLGTMLVMMGLPFMRVMS
jgi:hypothetical protein